ncbi:MAG: hypothetical protein DCF24_01140 [Cyanobium sp.]|nr:MAG: hypothetical protein DCF24_01140 [Cyanobium sp.]
MGTKGLPPGRVPRLQSFPILSLSRKCAEHLKGWLIYGRQELRFRPTRWERDVQRLEITSGELLPDQEILLLKRRP